MKATQRDDHVKVRARKWNSNNAAASNLSRRQQTVLLHVCIMRSSTLLRINGEKGRHGAADVMSVFFRCYILKTLISSMQISDRWN